MHPKLHDVFQKLEADKAGVLSSVATLTNEQFMRSVDGRWSISQILTHLLTSEKLALQYMRKKSLGVERLDKSGWVQPIKLLILKVSQRLPIKYKAPKGIVEKTPSPLTLTELTDQWNAERKQMELFLDSIQDKHIDKKIFKHPVAGMFNASQGLSFMLEHLRHHLPQVRRLLN